GAQHATRSLLLAETERLSNLVTLFAERPTLQRLARERATAHLPPYLEAFRQQSRLDLLLFCDTGGQPLAGNTPPDTCPGPPTATVALVAGRPAILASQEVDDDASGQVLGTATAGIWLDEPFLRQLAADTGVEQSILTPRGDRLSSTFAATGVPQTVPDVDFWQQPADIRLDGNRYFVAYSTLPAGSEDPVLLSEVALPVGDLVTTENRALLILGGSTGLVAILGGLLGLWYVWQVVAPLQRLTAAAEQVSHGDLMAPIPLISSPDEISTLATALHRSQTSMLKALQERSEARDWLNALVQSIVEGVVTVDGDGRITFFSQGAENLSGWSRDEALGRPLSEVFPIAGDEDDRFLQHVPQEGKKRQIMVRNRAGKSMVLAVTGAQVVPPGADTAQVAMVLRDVTEEEALRHLRAYFLANISHEFRTPLSTLNASIELLLDPAEDFSTDEMRELLKPTYLSLRALQTLIDNLLESSSIEAGQFTIQKRPTDLNVVLENALRMVGPLLERRRQPLTVGEPGALPIVPADAGRLTQVLVNLLANASKYCPPGAPVDIHVRQEAGALRIAVADRGPGIPLGERATVFRRFVRGGQYGAADADGEQYGIGLGLYVVKTVVEAHGGRVGVDDRPGGGSIFWFELPLNNGGTA
ncbi:MAG TPA: ATP-binding protein, partial [Candidatus Sulfomarinibacteraceae bacterium]|nr:ATP-binding protein [Candidatus Sulfomarinibacteraceae bacterium]